MDIEITKTVSCTLNESKHAVGGNTGNGIDQQQPTADEAMRMMSLPENWVLMPLPAHNNKDFMIYLNTG